MKIPSTKTKSIPANIKLDIQIWLKTNIAESSKLTIPELQEKFLKEYGVYVNRSYFYNWKSVHKIAYKSSRIKKSNKLEEIIDKQQKQLFVLCNAIKDLYYQQGLAIPDRLKRLDCSININQEETKANSFKKLWVILQLIVQVKTFYLLQQLLSSECLLDNLDLEVKRH